MADGQPKPCWRGFHVADVAGKLTCRSLRQADRLTRKTGSSCWRGHPRGTSLIFVHQEERHARTGAPTHTEPNEIRVFAERREEECHSFPFRMIGRTSFSLPPFLIFSKPNCLLLAKVRFSCLFVCFDLQGIHNSLLVSEFQQISCFSVFFASYSFSIARSYFVPSIDGIFPYCKLQSRSFSDPNEFVVSANYVLFLFSQKWKSCLITEIS